MKRRNYSYAIIILISVGAGIRCLGQIQAVVMTDVANFYQRPSTKSKVISVVQRGTKFKMISLQLLGGGWYEVASMKGDTRGWIQKDSVILVDRTPAKSEKAITDYSTLYKDEWLLFTSSDFVRFYYNPSKSSREGALMRIWSEAREKSDQEVASRTLYEFDCGASKVRSLAGVEFYTTNYTIAGQRQRFRLPSAESWDTPAATFKMIIPDTIIEDLYNVACKDKW